MAEAWALPGPATADLTQLADEMRQSGFSEQAIAAELAEHDTELELLAVNRPVIDWWQDAQELLRFTPGGFCQGLDWPQLEAEARMTGRPVTQDSVAGLKTFCRAFCSLINQRASK